MKTSHGFNFKSLFVGAATVVVLLQGCSQESEQLGSSDTQPSGNAAITDSLVKEVGLSERPTSIFAVWSTIDGVEGSHQSLTHPQDGFSIKYAESRGTESCVSKDLWSQMGSPSAMQLIDQQATIVIHLQEHNSVRTVYMQGDPADQSMGKNNLGLSTGLWEGKTLLVTTTFEGSDSLIQMHESFTLSADRSRLNYSQTLINPESNRLPVINHKWWGYVPDTVIQPDDCNSYS